MSNTDKFERNLLRLAGLVLRNNNFIKILCGTEVPFSRAVLYRRWDKRFAYACVSDALSPSVHFIVAEETRVRYVGAKDYLVTLIRGPMKDVKCLLLS